MSSFGISQLQRYYEFYFDSSVSEQSADNQYSPNNWPQFLLQQPLNNIAAVKVLEAQIPFSYYVINSTNNTFFLSEFQATISAEALVTIPTGNYTSTTILTALATALTTASATLRTWTYSVAYDSTKMKLTITNNQATAGRYFILRFGTSTSDIGIDNPRTILGYGPYLNQSSATTGTANTALLPAQFVIQLSGANYVYICSRSFGPIIKTLLPVYSGGTDNSNRISEGPIVTRVPMTTPAGSVCNWQDPDPEKYFALDNLSNFNQLDFYCVLGNNNQAVPIDFNGTAFSLKLGVLVNDRNHQDYLGGGAQNDRVVSRTWGVGNGLMKF